MYCWSCANNSGVGGTILYYTFCLFILNYICTSGFFTMLKYQVRTKPLRSLVKCIYKTSRYLYT